MNSIIYCLVLITVFFKSLEAAKFRCDYTYNKQADGYLKYIVEPSTWLEARIRCDFEGSILASPLNPNIRKAMIDMSNGTCHIGVWTGLNSIYSKGLFVSVEGVPLKDIDHKWMKCEPDNDKNLEECLVMNPDGTLADANCNETLSYFCYKKGQLDFPVNDCGYPEYNKDQRTGKCYKYHRYPRTWKRAYLTCQAEGGHLAIANSDIEAQVLKDLANKYPVSQNVGEHNTNVVFVGYHNYEAGEWRTIHGQTLEDAGWAKWTPGEPNNIYKQNCGAMFKSNGLLDDNDCDGRAYFICERDAKVCPE